MMQDTTSSLTLTSAEIPGTIADKFPLASPKTGVSKPYIDLQNPTLPPMITELLAVSLQALGFQFLQDDVKDPDDSPHRLNIARNGERTLYFVFIPSLILDNPVTENIGAVGSLFYWFNQGAKLYIFSEKLDVPAWAYRNVFKRWTQSGVAVMFVPWRDLMELKDKNPEIQKSRVMSILELDVKPPSAIRREDIDLLVSMLVAQAKTYVADRGGTEKFFLELVSTSSLPPKWTDDLLSAFGGTPDSAARHLVTWSIAKGENPDKPGHHALACILEKLLDAVGLGEQKDIMRIIREYQLIANAEDLGKLSKKFPL